jgi:hypothetical protein
VLVLVLGGGLPRGGEERLVPAVLRLVPGTLPRGRPSPPGRLAGFAVLAGGGARRRAARRSIIETATRNAAGEAADGPAPGRRLGLGEVRGQAQPDPAREHRRGP